MNIHLRRSLVVMGYAVLAAAGWVWSEQRVARLEAENARLLALLNEDRLIGTMRSRGREPAAREAGSDALVTQDAPSAPEPGGNLEAARLRIRALEGQLAELSLPLEVPDVASTVVNAAVRNGETLVTGGYADGEGNYVFTLATPRTLPAAGGDPAIALEFREVAISPAMVAQLGLDSITSGARNTLQHGETWTSEEAGKVLQLISDDPASSTIMAPSVTTRPGQAASVQMGEAGRSRTISVNAEVLPDASGVALRMRVEHRGVEEALAGESP